MFDPYDDCEHCDGTGFAADGYGCKPCEARRELEQLGALVLQEKPTCPQIWPFVRAIYEGPNGSCGCCLHIVLDDGNVDDDSVAFCVKWAEEQGHVRCQLVAQVLLKMSKTQRHKAARYGSADH